MQDHLNKLEMGVELSILWQSDVQITNFVTLVITYIGVIKAIMSSSICRANKKAACCKILVRGQMCRKETCHQNNYH